MNTTLLELWASIFAALLAAACTGYALRSALITRKLSTRALPFPSYEAALSRRVNQALVSAVVSGVFFCLLVGFAILLWHTQS